MFGSAFASVNDRIDSGSVRGAGDVVDDDAGSAV